MCLVAENMEEIDRPGRDKRGWCGTATSLVVFGDGEGCVVILRRSLPGDGAAFAKSLGQKQIPNDILVSDRQHVPWWS